MAHIAFFVIPFAGHVNPSLAVAAELVRRGHRVSYPITAELADRVAATGALPIPYETTTRSAAFTADMRGYARREAFTADDFVRVLRNTLRETVAVLPPTARAFAGDEPDLIVHDPSGWTGKLLAERWRVPTVQSMPTFAANEHWSLAAGYTAAGVADPAAVLRGLGGLIERLGLPLTVEEFLAGDPAEPALVYLPRAFQYAGETFGDSVHFVGPCLGERSFHGRWMPRHPAEPLVLVSLGTFHNRQPRFFRSCIDAMADLPWRVVIAHGGGVTAAELGPLPAAVEAHAFVPQADVLAHTTVFVNHGGMGTVMESLHAGVPMVVVPQIAEHRATADRIVQLGLGARLDRERVRAETVRQAVEFVAAHTSTSAMRDEIRRAGGAPAAADVIEKVLAQC
ncbi:macrolide family glycosyltransferase [Kutzneria buriramensis]|uniref:Demethyllactenocin mycarosyltransferase n=1 Tax=Kutzneria buriramensis TaxID=1045776 RepID=A0A3E0GZD1_9PSEU|nr:macrolide family glycosyltransferase [Kutzneria buriramensis]REH35695.1 demethyllactenocin mycarosyltransferase [Kutzneria buriramensis]